MGEGLLSPIVGALAYELAAKLRPGREVLARYGVPVGDFRRLLATPAFQDMIRRAKQEFGSLASTPDRVRLKAQLLTEMGLDEMWRLLGANGTPAAAKVSAYNSIKALTGMDRPEDAKPIQRFSLKIILPSASPFPAGTLEIPTTLEMTAEQPDQPTLDRVA